MDKKLFIAVFSSIFLTFIVMILIFGVINQGNVNKMVKMAKVFENNQAILVSKCNIDLNALEKQQFEQQRCDSWNSLFEQEIIDKNFYDSTGCIGGFDFNGIQD